MRCRTRNCGCDGNRRRCSAAGSAALQGFSCPPADLRGLLEAMVANGFDIEEILLQQPTRGEARIALARQVAMYLAHVACGLSKVEAGRLFGRDRSTVHYACIVVEERRDDEAFNRALDHLERIIRVVVGSSRTEAACCA